MLKTNSVPKTVNKIKQPKEEVCHQIKGQLKRIFRLLGYEIKSLKPIKNNHFKEYCWKYKTNLNIGSGSWYHPKWTCLDLKSEWYHSGVNNGFIPYNVLKDKIPFEDSTVDLIYCSHVIEHLPDWGVENLANEIVRVLRPGGGVRILCPDAELIFETRNRSIDFWMHRKDWVISRLSVNHDFISWKNIDFIVREIATPKCKYYKYKRSGINLQELESIMDYKNFMNYLVSDLVFNPEFPGDHINYWDYNKLRDFLEVGLRTRKSAYGQSFFAPLQDIRYFDTTAPWMSLYVEALKPL